MESILQWGIDFIRTIQSIESPPLTAVIRFITNIGGEAAYLALLPFLYWCVDEKKGLRLGIVILFSAWINVTLKYLLDQPRPFFPDYDPSLGMISERLGGLPSGHAQNSLVLFVILAFWVKKNWAYICAAVLCLLIGFSRIYLGVHFPTDVIAGWIIGGIILYGYFTFSGRIEELLVKGGHRAGMIAAAVVSFIMILYIPVPGRTLLLPGGVTLGLGVGYCLNRRYVGFKSGLLLERTGLKKYLTLAVRLLVGFIGFILILAAGDKLISPDFGNYKLFVFVQLALVGFWVSFLSLWVFVKLRLAGFEIAATEKES